MSDFPDFLKSDAAAWKWAEANVDLSIDEDNTTIAQMQREEYESKAIDYASFAREAASLSQLTIYRAVCVPEPTVIQTHNLGKAWSRYAKTAGCYGGGDQGDSKVVITGVVSVADVDWAYGFTSFMYYGEDQWEVSLDGNAPVLVTAIDGKKCEPPIAGNTGHASEEWRAAEGRRALAWGAVEAGDSVPLTKLYAWAPKLQETWDDVQAGRVSKTDGPVRLTHLDSPRGAFFVLDGHHRVIEAILRGDTTIRFAIDAYVPRIERTGGAHRQIVEEKRNVVEFVREQATHVAREATIPSTWYHLTDRARFKLDPNFEPSDNAVAIEDRSGRPGIYLGQSVEKWVNGFGYWRPFVVEFKVDPSVVNDPGVHGRYGGEMFVPASSFDKLTILRVIPIDAYAREEFGEPGWIESDLGVEFDTGAPLQARYKGYRYPGPDVRQMSPDEVARLKKQMRQVKGVAAAPVEEAQAPIARARPIWRAGDDIPDPVENSDGTMTFYHGTIAARVDAIRRDGLCPNLAGYGDDAYVYLAPTEGVALWWASRRAWSPAGSGSPIVLTIRIPKGWVRQTNGQYVTDHVVPPSMIEFGDAASGVAHTPIARARPIPLDKSKIDDATRYVLFQLATELGRRHPQDEPLGTLQLPQYVMRTGVLALEGLPNVRGQRIQAPVVYVNSYASDAHEVILSGGAGELPSGRHAILVNINGRFTVERLLRLTQRASKEPANSVVFKDLRKMLLHEVTHTLDEPREHKETARTVPLDVNRTEYYNRPNETRAYLAEIVDQVLAVAPKLTDVHGGDLLRDALSLSDTWREVEIYWTEENRKLVLRAVYRALDDAGYLTRP